MKTFKEFLEESINISGNASVGTIIVGGQQEPERVGEEFTADILYQGNIHRISMVTENGIPSKPELAEFLQDEYPGAMVQQIYTIENSSSSIKITKDKRFHPAKLDWV